MPAKSLVDLIARRSGHFRFESGHHGDRWLEPDLLLQRPTALRPFAIALGDWSTRFAAEHDLALEGLERLGNNLWTPEECPLCAAGEPLQDLSG